MCLRRYQVMADATKAMHQLDSMDIAGNKIQVKIAALSPLDASLPAAAGAAGAIPGAGQGVDLDDTVEGAPGFPLSCSLCKPSACELGAMRCPGGAYTVHAGLAA